MFSFIETKLFSRLAGEHLSDDEYAELQKVLIADPEAGALISGSGVSGRFAGEPLAEENEEACGSSTTPRPIRESSGC